MEKISIRKYSKLVGVSHTAVAKAITAGHISKGWDSILKKVIVGFANSEWGNDIIQKNGQGKTQKQNDGVSFKKSLSAGNDLEQTKENISYSEARRRKEIYNAELSRILALKEQGLYVEKEKVYKALYDYGQTLRKALQAIPDRIIDNVLAAKNRFEAHSILLNEINDVLETLTKFPKLEE